MIVYFNGNYLRKEQVAISPDDRGFLFAKRCLPKARGQSPKNTALAGVWKPGLRGYEFLFFPSRFL
jgi:hypothetical protein